MTVIRDMVGGLSRTPLAAEEDVRPWEKTRWNASTMRPATMTMAAGRHRRSRLATVRYRVGKGTSAASQNASAFGMSTRKMADQAVGDIAQDEDTAARDRGEDAAARDHADRHGEIDHDRHGAGGAGTGSGEPAARRAATRRLALWCSELAGATRRVPDPLEGGEHDQGHDDGPDRVSEYPAGLTLCDRGRCLRRPTCSVHELGSSSR